MSSSYSSNRLPGRTLDDKASAQFGREVIRIESIAIQAGDMVLVRFETAVAIRRQGIWLATQGLLEVASQASPQFWLWSDSAPDLVEVSVVETDGWLRFHNIYESPKDPGSPRSLMYGAGMVRQDQSNGWIRYACNDFGVPPTFDKLAFSIKPPS